MLLVRSPNLYLKLSGAAAAGIVVLPVIAALVMYWRRGGFESEQGLLNGDEATPSLGVPHAADAATPETPPHATIDYTPLPRAAWWGAGALLVAGIACLAIPISHFGRAPVYRISAAEARKASDEFLRTQSLNPDTYLHVTWPAAHWEGPDALAAQYFLERMRPERASELFERYRPLQHWSTRYFRALDRDEITVSVHPESGRVRAVVHTLPEDAPGEDVTPERAREIATAFAASLGQDVSAMDLKESESEKKKARRDYSLVWEARPGDPRNVGETKWRVQVEVAGDRAVSLTQIWKPPETFERERERESAISIAVLVARIVASAGLIVFGLWVLMDAIRDGTLRWHWAIRLALPAALLFPVGALLSAHLMMRNYDTAKPLETFQAIAWMGLVVATLLGILMAMAAAAVVATLVPDALRALRRENRRAMGLDAIAALAAAIGLGLIVYQVSGLLGSLFPAQSLPSITAPELIASRVPALSAIAGAARSWLMNAAMLALATTLARRAWRRHLAVPVALVAAAALLPAEVRTPAEFAVHYFEALVALGALLAFCRWFGRRNWLAYGIVLWVAALRSPLAQLFGNGNEALDAQGWMVATVMVVTVLWAVARALGRSPQPVE
jgi:hypothetical protein